MAEEVKGMERMPGGRKRQKREVKETRVDRWLSLPLIKSDRATSVNAQDKKKPGKETHHNSHSNVKIISPEESAKKSAEDLTVRWLQRHGSLAEQGKDDEDEEGEERMPTKLIQKNPKKQRQKRRRSLTRMNAIRRGMSDDDDDDEDFEIEAPKATKKKTTKNAAARGMSEDKRSTGDNERDVKGKDTVKGKKTERGKGSNGKEKVEGRKQDTKDNKEGRNKKAQNVKVSQKSENARDTLENRSSSADTSVKKLTKKSSKTKGSVEVEDDPVDDRVSNGFKKKRGKGILKFEKENIADVEADAEPLISASATASLVKETRSNASSKGKRRKRNQVDDENGKRGKFNEGFELGEDEENDSQRRKKKGKKVTSRNSSKLTSSPPASPASSPKHSKSRASSASSTKKSGGDTSRTSSATNWRSRELESNGSSMRTRSGGETSRVSSASSKSEEGGSPADSPSLAKGEKKRRRDNTTNGGTGSNEVKQSKGREKEVTGHDKEERKVRQKMNMVNQAKNKSNSPSDVEKNESDGLNNERGADEDSDKDEEKDYSKEDVETLKKERIRLEKQLELHRIVRLKQEAERLRKANLALEAAAPEPSKSVIASRNWMKVRFAIVNKSFRGTSLDKRKTDDFDKAG